MYVSFLVFILFIIFCILKLSFYTSQFHALPSFSHSLSSTHVLFTECSPLHSLRSHSTKSVHSTFLFSVFCNLLIRCFQSGDLFRRYNYAVYLGCYFFLSSWSSMIYDILMLLSPFLILSFVWHSLKYICFFFFLKLFYYLQSVIIHSPCRRLFPLLSFPGHPWKNLFTLLSPNRCPPFIALQ